MIAFRGRRCSFISCRTASPLTRASKERGASKAAASANRIPYGVLRSAASPGSVGSAGWIRFRSGLLVIVSGRPPILGPRLRPFPSGRRQRAPGEGYDLYRRSALLPSSTPLTPAPFIRSAALAAFSPWVKVRARLWRSSSGQLPQQQKSRPEGGLSFSSSGKDQIT